MFSLVRKECLILGLVSAAVSASARVRPGEAPHWIKMPLLTAEARKAGVTLGGEGSQWPRGPVAVSPADPDFLLLPIDVGGLPAMLQIDAHGTIYAAGVEGLFRSVDKGRSFVSLRKAEVDGLSLTPDGTVYLSDQDGVSVSHDGGRTFTLLPCHGLDRQSGFAVNGIAVSPVDPRRMLCWAGGPNFVWPRRWREAFRIWRWTIQQGGSTSPRRIA